WQRHAAAPAGTGGDAATQAARGGKGATVKRSIPVQAAQVTQGTLHVYFNALGTVTSPNAVVVRPRVDGQLMRFAVKEGDTVKAGELIAQIDPRAFQVALAQAEGQLARDTAQLQNARLNLDRYKTLLSQESIAPQQVETQQALVQQYEGTIKADKAAVDSARLQLTYSSVVAPASGRLGLRVVDTGNVVRASDTAGIITINQVQPINVLFTLTEAQLGQVMQPLMSGARLPTEAWDREQKHTLAKGRVVSVDNQIDTTTGTVKVKAQFANDDAALFPNQFVNVRLLAQTRQDATLAPVAAVQRGRDGAFVYVLKPDNTVTQRKVALGATEGDRIEVINGVQPGDTVIIDGIDQLREGVKVDVADASALLKEPAGKRKRGNRAKTDASAPRATGN
ncbi:MAG: MdtA/MuxA family multidrug efflux RND transporter periplasmic adaptor subunit, partial [Rhodocyclaceae bacterium]